MPQQPRRRLHRIAGHRDRRLPEAGLEHCRMRRHPPGLDRFGQIGPVAAEAGEPVPRTILAQPFQGGVSTLILPRLLAASIAAMPGHSVLFRPSSLRMRYFTVR
jgi:hypothetical protein